MSRDLRNICNLPWECHDAILIYSAEVRLWVEGELWSPTFSQINREVRNGVHDYKIK
jgi:hypothetical protein